MTAQLRQRLFALGPLIFVLLTVLAGALGGTTQTANAQAPSYPTIGPTTTVPGATVPPTTAPVAPTIVTVPQMGPYPVVVPTTAPPATTTTAQPPPPTTTARPVPRWTAPPTTLVPLEGAAERFASAEEHRTVRINAGFGTSASYTITTGPVAASISADGYILWTPGEADGNSTVEFMVRAVTTDHQVRDVSVHVLVSETNSPPVITGPKSVSAVAGDVITIKYVASDIDDPPNKILWSTDGAAGATITNGLLKWTIDGAAPTGDLRVSITATDDGKPAMNSTEHLVVTVQGVNLALVSAVADDGTPLSPMVIAAMGDLAPLQVDLTKPGELMVALSDRTPSIDRIAPPPVDSNREPGGGPRTVTKMLNRKAVIASVQHAYRLLLNLEVPKAAVAGGLAWQIMLLALPGLLLRSDNLFDITGLGPGQEIGDDRFRFRGNATSLKAGARRWKHGSWMRAVDSPAGPIWIPASNLRSSFRDD